MIDYKGLHAKIKAKLKPDSPVPEGWEIMPNKIDGYLMATNVSDDHSLETRPWVAFHDTFEWTPPACIEWFANALGIPLEDNGYTDLVLAAELQLSISREWHEVKTDDEIEAWSDYANDGEIGLRAALERIKEKENG